MLSLREIEIAGFKSFAERTKVLLHGDVLVVVGPNGSGKSNVADAVLWALGEQSPKSLRGKQMQDVIFDGTAKRPPAGQAEVFLTFDDGAGGRIQMGRRLTRAGDSTYLLEGRAARLKDIHDFCHRHAISTQGSYLVEQGRIEDLLKANPEERRLLFEEVAGISHYKENRRSALQKLEGTQANLLRLNDILLEVETQMGALKKQAAKADRFVRLSEELRTRRREYYGRSFAELTGRRGVVARELELYRKEREKRETLLATLESELERARLRLNEHETSAGALGEAIHQKELDHNRQEQANKHRAEQMIGTRSRLQNLDQDRETLKGRLEEARKESAAADRDRASLSGDEAAAKAAVEAAEKETAAARAEVESFEARIQALRASAFESAQVWTVAQSSLKRLEDDLRKAAEAEARIVREQEVLKGRLAALGDAGKSSEARLGEAEATAKGAREEREGAETALTASRAALEVAVQALSAAASEAAAQDSRLKVLRQQEGARRTSAEAHFAEKAPGRAGKTLARALKGVPKSLAPALSAVLGELLEGFVDEAWEGLPELLEGLRKDKAGTAVFWAAGAPPRTVPPGAASAPGFQGWLHEAEGLPAGLRPMLPLAARVRTAGEAREFVKRFGAGAVTGEGLFIHPDGWVRGGAGGTGAASRFELEQELGDAETALEGARAALAAAQARQEACAGELGGFERSLAACRTAEESAGVALAEARAEAQRVEAEQGRLQETLDLSRMEAEQAKSDRESFEAERAATQRRLTEAQSAREKGEAETQQAEQAQAAARGRLDRAHAAMAEAKGKEGEVSARVATAETRCRGAARWLKDLEETEVRQTRERETLEARAAQLQTEITAGDQALRALLLTLEEDRRRRSTFEEQLAALREECASRERQVREARENLDQARGEVSRYEVEQATADADYKNVLERIGETFEESPEVLAGEFQGQPPLTGEERERFHAEVVKLDARIADMGAVNMLAREEFAEHEQRFTFLSDQKKDLEQAVASLEETIRKINRTIRDRFLDAFHGVGEHFTHLFREISEGGEARLSLLDEANPLETGVEVWAQPPGKKLKALGLLSGGEKAMVALALLFALFRYRPQPFFILDEADAPLDEANINRFGRLLAQFRAQTQFLIVTHNKRTMEMATVLYGVTMAERGISRLVSVKLGDPELPVGEAPAPLPPGPTAPPEPPPPEPVEPPEPSAETSEPEPDDDDAL